MRKINVKFESAISLISFNAFTASKRQSNLALQYTDIDD